MLFWWHQWGNLLTKKKVKAKTWKIGLDFSRLSLRNMLRLVITLISIMYRIFIFAQMSLLFVGESIRLRRLATYLINSAKKRKIMQYKD